MSKTKSAFFCQSCGYESTKWAGKCPSCNAWNTFVEEVIIKGTDKKEKNTVKKEIIDVYLKDKKRDAKKEGVDNLKI